MTNYFLEKKIEMEKTKKIIDQFTQSNPKPKTIICHKHNIEAEYDIVCNNGLCSYALLETSCQLCEAEKVEARTRERLCIPSVYTNLQKCVKFQKIIGEGRGIFITGRHGVGKSKLLCEIALQHDSPIVDFKQLCVNVLNDIDNLHYRIDKLQNERLLLIDGLGEEVYDGYKHSEILNMLICVVDYRWKWKKATCITSNLTEEQIGIKYGTAVSSRLFNRGDCQGMLDILKL